MTNDTKLRNFVPSGLQNSPFRNRIERDIVDRDWNHLMGQFFGPSALTKGNLFTDPVEYSDSSVWAPRVDVSEDENTYFIHAELPGMKKEDVKVHVENGLLVLEGERKHETETSENGENGRNYHRIERSYGKFHRAFRLPRTVDSTKISAKFTEGLLELNVPKAEEAKPKTIDIKVK